jgi:antirestriction protein ArdC/DNA polymerase III epsilon subunit-like protein
MDNKSPILHTSERVFSTREQARIIRSEALEILEKANEFSSTSRRVSKRSAYKVIARSLAKSKGLPFSIRKYQAFSELSTYIALAKNNKVVGLTAFNTDLLPISHPRSTRAHSMTAAAVRQAQINWVIDDPKLKDDSVKTLLASAMMSHPDSPEHIYAMKRIELLPQGTVPLQALVAAYGDGNSRAARSARAKLQRRDRKGRFAEMFGTFKLILGLRDGGKASATGRILGQNIFSPDLLDMELPDGRIAAVPISQGEQPEAFLDDSSDEARKNGYVRASDLDIDDNAPVVPEDSLAFMEAPSGFRSDKDYKGPGNKYTDESFDVTVFDGPSPQTRDLIDAAIKRSRELDLEDPRQVKLGEDGKLWDPDRKLFAVNKRGENTQFAFAQNWKDALAEISRKEKIDDEEKFEQGEEEESVALAKDLKGGKKKAAKKTEEKAKLPSDQFKYNVPERSLELDPNYNYIPEGSEDDPAMLAAMQSEDELQNGLVDALEPVNSKTPATGLGRLEDENGEEFEVPAEAILSAISEQGGDTEMALAKAYDTINNNSENEKALTESRSKERKEKAAEPKELDEVFDEVVSKESETPEKPVAEISEEDETVSNEDMLEALNRIPALAGLSRAEKQSVIDNDDYMPFIPKNENINFPEGMYTPLESSKADKEEAVSLASVRNFSDDDLIKGLDDSIKNGGSSDVLTLDENGEFVPSSVSAESWRDAIALRGQDANRVLKDIANGTLDLAKEKKESESRARKRQQEAAKKGQKRRDNLRKALGFTKTDSWNDLDILNPILRAQNLFGDDPDYEKDLNDLIESYKSFLEGKDLDKYDDAEAALKEFKEAVDSTTSDDEKYQKLVDAVKESINDSLESIEGWRERNPNPLSEDISEDETDTGKVSVPETLPEGWGLVEGTDNQMVSDKKTGDIIGYQDREGTKPHWYIITDANIDNDSTDEFPSFEDALKYWNDNYKDVERVYPEGTPAGEYDATQQGKIDEEILEEEEKEAAGAPPSGPPPTDGDEGPPKKIITYKRSGKRTLLRGGKGAPFRDKDIADFLAENGFTWSDTVERDGRTINVKAQTALQEDKEFKAFARELRDRFNIDLQPRSGQDPIDFDSEDEVDETAATTESTPVPPSSELKDKLIKRDGIQMIKITGPNGEEIETPVFNLAGRPIVLINVNGVRMPFYISTGSGGKKNVPVGKWYPIFGIGADGWFNKGNEEEINDYFGSPELKEAAEWLNANIGDIRKENMPEFEDLTDELREQVNQDLTPGRYYENAIVYGNRAIALAKISGDEERVKEEEDLLKKNLDEAKALKRLEDAIFGKDREKEDTEPVEGDETTSETVETPEVILDEETEKPSRTPKPEETIVEETIVDVITEEGPKPTVDDLVNKVKDKLESDDKVSGNFGTRKDMISKLMWFKWGAGAYRNESQYIRSSMKDYKKKLENLSDQDMIDMLNLYYDEMDAIIADQNERKERSRKLADARARKRKEREDKLLEESEDKPEETSTEEETPKVAEEKPTPLSVKDKEVLKALVDRRRKIQRKIDRADLSEETTPAQKKALKDELDEVTRIIDEIVLGERPAESVEVPTEETSTTEEVTPEASKPIKTSVRGADLQPGDVTVNDFFTITNVEGGYKKTVKGVEVPASIVSGYYPGSVEQSSKLWADDTLFDVYRGATPPEKGDLPELRQPKREDFRGDSPGYNEARAKYDEELDRRKSTWTPPTDVESVSTAQAPRASIVSVKARDLKPGDITFSVNEKTKELERFFVVTEVLEETREYVRPDNGEVEIKAIVRGYYPGHTIQENDWNEGAIISAIRGESEANMPKSGDKPEIERIPNGTLKGKEYFEKRAEIEEARREAGKDYKPSVSPALSKPDRPNRPAFFGSAEKLTKLKDGAAIWEALKDERVVYFDFETVGTGRFDYDDPDAPIQLAASLYEKGKKVGEIDLFMNPGQPLDDYYYTKERYVGKTRIVEPYLDENGNRALNPEKVIDNKGVKVDDEWLSTQPSIEDQLRKFAEFIGKDAILVAHNAEFDTNTFEKWAKKFGIEYSFGGVIDTIEIDAANKGVARGSSLVTVAKKAGVDAKDKQWHNAVTDSEVLPIVLEDLLKKMKPENREFEPELRKAEYESKLEQYEKDLADFKAQGDQPEAVSPSTFGSDGPTDKVTDYAHVSIFGDIINEAWALDDENTYAVNGGGSVVVDELQIGDILEGTSGLVEVVDIQIDPENSDKLIIYRKRLRDGKPFSERVEPSSTPGVGWARGKVLRGVVRRRSSIGKIKPEDIKDILPKPIPSDPTPKISEKQKPVKGQEVTDPQAASVVADAIETITSGAKSGKKVKEAIKDLNIDETIKDQVIAREGSSKFHIDANNVAIKAGDRVRNVKNGRTGTVSVFWEEYGKNKYKNYLKVRYDDTKRRENVSASSLEVFNLDDGDNILSSGVEDMGMGMSIPEGPTTRGLVSSIVDAKDLKPGDKLDPSGKTTIHKMMIRDDKVYTGKKTRGSRGGGGDVYLLTDKVKVWRKPEDTPETPMGMALPDMGAEVYDMAPLSEEGSAVPNALPEDNYEYAGEKFPPTAEQRNVVTAIMTGDNVVVRALAGTGKTSTLTLAARRLLEEQPKKKIVYIAFNKTVQMEAEGKMPKNVESRTGDSIAFQGVSNDIRQKFLNQKGKTANMKLRAEDIADELGIKPTGVKLKGVEVSLSSREIPAIIKQAVNNFSISADDELGAKHFTEELDEVPRSFVEYANAYWDDLNSPAGVFGINNAHITKIWALSNPDLGSIGSGMKTPADVIFFDEAQDINPVIAKVIADQTIQKVYVGDGNQAIYAFRGAEDQLDRTTAKWDLPLTQSFRFGPEIAGMANRFLTQLDSKYRVEGSGSKGEVVDGMEDPDVVITRTNSGGFRAMIELLDAGKVVGITKGTKDELESLVLSASWLIGDQTKFKKPTMHPDLAEFKNWSEVKEAVEKGEGRKVKALYDLVVQNGIGSIKDILSRVKVATPESEKKDLKPSSDFKKITLDQAEDGAKGSIGEGINYEVKDKAIRLSGNGTFKGKDKIKDQNFRWDATGKQWFKEVEDDLDRQKAINDLRRGVGGFAPDAGEEEDEIDVIVTTAHKSKGLQWNNVRIFDDFWGPRTNKKTGELEMPVDEELRLAYVALTRAQKKLDPGPLNWIKEYTEDEDESPKKPTAVETAMGMALPTEKVTEDEFNESTVKTAEKIDPAVEKVANAIIEAIERGTVPWQKPWTGGGFLPTSVATGKTYEGSNILVLWAAMEKNGWTDNRFLTYNKAEKLGGNIRRGEKGTQVIHWPQIFKEVEKPDGTKEKVRVYRPPTIRTVFNVEQAENIDLPAIVKGEPIPVTEGETAILEAYKDKPEILFVAQDQAFYSPIDDIIKLPQREQFKSEQSFFETLVHELAHSTGHRSRLDRTELLDNYGKHLESRGEEELIAEITVALVAGRLGVKIDFENVAAYAKSWLPAVKNNPQMIVKAAKQAQRAVDHMLGKQEEPEGPVDEDGNPIGSGVGSEGKTGEEIAAEKKAEPENKDERTV